ncbi:MAG: glycosyltransferase family 4 protein [Planctomycetes bacterium]|nr:glycosyltransferase family 4 protein [Planctomycetota bacterium]
MKDGKRKSNPVRRAIFGALGGIRGAFWRKKNPGGLFFFFNHAVVGGADLVHAQIVQAVADKHPWVFFTLPSETNTFADKFPREARIVDIGRKVTGKASKFFQIGKIAALINRHTSATVFCGHSRFFYELAPRLKPHVRCIDLVHALATLEHFSLPAVPRLNARIVITPRVKDDLRAIYLENGLDGALADRIQLIENSVEVPASFAPKPPGPLRVLFVGRGSKEKRVHLIGRLATACKTRGIAVEFTLVGDVDGWLEPAHKPNVKLEGVVTDRARLDAFYDRADILIITSIIEGFPLVVMEAMARGGVPLCTNVGGMPRHVIPGQTGFLVESGAEEKVVTDMADILAGLDRGALGTLAANCHTRAVEYFSATRFRKAYRDLLL